MAIGYICGNGFINDGSINDIMTKYFYSMRIYTIFYKLWKLSGYDPIGYDPKIAIESIESEF